MCACTRHKWQNLSPEFCELWEKMEAIQNDKNAELSELKRKYGPTIKAYKGYRKIYQETVQRWQEIYEPLWDEFDDKFNDWKNK